VPLRCGGAVCFKGRHEKACIQVTTSSEHSAGAGFTVTPPGIAARVHAIGQAIGITDNLGVAMIDHTRAHVYANAAYIELLGLPKTTVRDRVRFDDVLQFLAAERFLNKGQPLHLDAQIARLNRDLASNTPTQFSEIFVAKDGRQIRLQGLFLNDNCLFLTSEKLTPEAASTRTPEPASVSVPKTESAPKTESVSETECSASSEGRAVVPDLADAHISVSAPIHAKATRAQTGPTSLMGGIGRELDTPIRAIQSMASVLEMERLSPRAAASLDIIKVSAAQLETVMFCLKGPRPYQKPALPEGHDLNMIDVSPNTLDSDLCGTQNIQAQDIQWVSPRKVLGNVMKIWQAGSPSKTITLKLSIARSVPKTLLLDTARLQYCLHSLIADAVDATECGDVRVIAKIENRGSRDFLMIAVKDNCGANQRPKAGDGEHNSATAPQESRMVGRPLNMVPIRQIAALIGAKIGTKKTKNGSTTRLMVMPILKTITPDAVLPKPVDTARSPSNTVTAQPTNDIVHKRVDLSPAPTPAPALAPAKPAQATLDTPTDLKPVFRSNRDVRDDEAAFAGLSVLCVDDNLIDQTIVKSLIGGRVDRLYFASDGHAALDILKTVSIDIVLMDIHMRGMDGIEASIAIRKANADFSNVVIMTVTADPDFQKEHICRSIGMDDILPKPVTRLDMARAFKRVTRPRSARPQAMRQYSGSAQPCAPQTYASRPCEKRPDYAV